MTLEEAIEEFGETAVLRATHACIPINQRRDYWFDLFKMGMGAKEISEDFGLKLATVSAGITARYKTSSGADRAAFSSRVRIQKPLVDRFWDFVIPEPNTGCWLWTGRDNMRYGILKNGRGNVYAHRFSYELAKGQIPDGLVIDHLCNIPLCVNPDHLEAVTQAENLRRARERRHV